MKKLAAVFIVMMISGVGWAQTCTITASGGWNTRTCQETGVAPTAGATIIIQSGVTVTTNSNNQVLHTGNFFVFGTLDVNHNNVVINGNVTIENGGKLDLTNGNLSLGTSTSCGYTIVVEAGGLIDLGTTGSDRLIICGVVITRGGGGCNPFPAGPLPYCEPTGGFPGPVDLGENGVLPIELIFFNAAQSGSAIKLNWATSMEEDFSHFVVQHAVNGFDYDDLDEVAGAGYNTESQNDYEYTHTLPLIGYNYYRLKAIDLNGSFEYFGPVVEQFTGSRALWIHPNPVTTDKVEYQLNFTPNEGDRIQVFNGVGQVVADMPADQNTGVVYFSSPVQSGSYILKYISSTSSYFARFIVLK